MARVTVEDCIDKVDSPYELVLVAKERATQLNSGIEPTLDRDNDKHTVIALREIAEETIKVPDLTEAAVYKLRKHVEQIDDTAEEDEDIGDDFENQTSTTNYFVATPEREKIEFQPIGDVRSLKSGEAIKATGYRVDDQLIVDKIGRAHV